MPSPPAIAGLSYTSFTADGFRQGAQRGALAEMREQTAASWVALVVFEFQTTPTSADIAPNTTGRHPVSGAAWSTSSTEDDLRAGAADARRNGLKVMLKPHVDLYSGEWRAAIRPSNAWFDAYESFLLRYARLAAELQVESFCVGVEYVRCTTPAWTPRWRRIIERVREVYPGRLTYAANWDGAFEIGTAEFEQVGFWDALDEIGVDAYWPVTRRGVARPTLSQSLAMLSQPVRRIEALAWRLNKPVLLTEVGCPSVQGGHWAPWEWVPGTDGVPDPVAQALYYEAIMHAFGPRAWFRGAFWWNWESVPSSTEHLNFTPRWKPAAGVLRRWYGGRV